MTFVTADSNRVRLEKLTRSLVAAFPGSTVYQHADPQRAMHDALGKKVDAVFVAAEERQPNVLELMRMLHRQKPDIPVFVISETDELRTEAVESGADAYFLCPVSEESLKAVLCSKNCGENIS